MSPDSPSNASKLIALRDQFVARGVFQVAPTVAASANGAVVTDVDGREYLDFSRAKLLPDRRASTWVFCFPVGPAGSGDAPLLRGV